MVLTEKQRNILTEYYNDDLSLAEIAENYGITRQGVRDAIKHGEATLMEMEEKLGTARRTEAIRADLARLEELVSEVRVCNTGLFEPDTRIQRATEEMLTIIHRLDTQEELPDGI
ncbi:MAG: DNA-binding protein [Subdoligranulum sp.]|nr:DNA-binding protein [Subdoligranulum sp.]MCI6219923.1 DNA-binding protein [Subdoligranulum sp.]MCI6446672.1 DNA-binding protein [Subdoligranulum sp.]MCI6624145.1 DNA-binding protein [Subdoligranulum sp.]